MAPKVSKVHQDYLLVLDSRTAESYQIRIDNNAILGSDIGDILGPDASEVEESKSESGHTNGNGHVNGNGAVSVIKPSRKTRGLRIFDAGLENIAIMKSSITSIDGERGIIKYRDIMIEDLFRDYVYEDVMHLLIWGEIPSEAKKQETRGIMGKVAVPTDAMKKVVRSFPPESESYHMIMAGMAAFGSGDSIIATARHQQKPVFQGNLAAADPALLRTIQYMATTTAFVYCYKHNIEFTNPEPSRSLIENLVLMMGFHDKEAQQEKPQPDPKIVECLNKLWILYADFEMTASTAAVLQAGSSLADPVSCAIAGIVAGHGPLHGGAIELAYEAFGQIGSPENVKPFIAGIKAGKGRLFGYGHRVLKNRDPRGVLMKEIMGGKLAQDFARNPMLQIALTIDRVAREDPYFIERNLHVNVDLYGSFPYIALGFHKDAITAVTILSRFAGPLAHWRESLMQPARLWRPRQLYEPNTHLGVQ